MVSMMDAPIDFSSSSAHIDPYPGYFITRRSAQGQVPHRTRFPDQFRCNFADAKMYRRPKQRLREIALSGTVLAHATAATVRVRLLKIGAAIMRNIRRIRILFASPLPLRELFLTTARALAAP